MLASVYPILSPDVCNIGYCIAIDVASLIGIAVYQFRQCNCRHSLVKSGYDIQNIDMLMKVIVLQPQTVKCAMNAYKQELIFITPVSCQLSPLEHQTDNWLHVHDKNRFIHAMENGTFKIFVFLIVWAYLVCDLPDVVLHTAIIIIIMFTVFWVLVRQLHYQ